MATWADLLNYKQYVVRSDGAKFRDGVRDDNLDTSWLTISPTVSLGPGLYDELMVLPRVATTEEIEAWAQAGAPWYDPSPAIDAAAQNVRAKGTGGAIDLDEQGMRATRYSDGATTLYFDTGTGDLSIAGDLTGSAGDFANGKVRIGDIAGKPWGDGTLPSGTAGIWGEGAGLYLRGYARIIEAGYKEDEELIDVSGRVLGNPRVLVAPKSMLTFYPTQPEAPPVIFTDVIEEATGKYRVKAKTMIKGIKNPLTKAARSYSSWTWTRPTSGGLNANFFGIKVKTEIPYDRTLDIYQYVTNQFSDGTPINWQLKRHIKAQGSGVPDYSHQTHNLDISLPLDNWAVRVTVSIPYYPPPALAAEMTEAYYETTTYINIDGQPIGGTAPSGMSVMYYVFDEG